jgi:hypothetical protein
MSSIEGVSREQVLLFPEVIEDHMEARVKANPSVLRK